MAIDNSSKRFLKKFGLRLRGLREERDWTLEYTEELGWPDWTHMQRIEAGKKNINLSTILRLSKIYKMSISDLFKGL